MRLRAAFLFPAILSSTLFAQRQAPAPPPQSARQALIEILTGGQKAVGKHLTVEVQQLLAKSGAKSAAVLGVFDQIRQAGPETQAFESGPLLLVINNPAQHQKLEVHVENDDLSGDEDTLELSLHVARENADQQPEEWESFLSRISVNMKKQAGIWRLNKVGAGVEFPLGDPEFLQKMFLKGMDQATGSGVVASGSQVELNTTPEAQEKKMPPEQLLKMMAFAEYSYAQTHPDVGFSCSMGDLTESAKPFGIDQQVSTGIVQGYKLSVTGCQGHPAGSFQIVAEPLQGTGGKAFCTDATQNVRVADDGSGATCLAFGRVPTETQNDHLGFYSATTDVVVTAPRKDQK
ncbi:MAG TPA: hypothetical protein VKH81_15170 [Candidatus Angelobacter sp.]|nr:hypothetical protein [Candidatus Angelobacter sp.]